MKYLTTLVAVCLLLPACGDSRTEPSTLSSGGVRSQIELLNRPRAWRDRLSSGVERQLARTVIVDHASVRHAATLRRGWTIWVFRGALSGPAVLGAPETTCLAVLDRREQVLAEKCVSEAALVDPRRSMVILGGGADGSPGLGAREILVLGLLGGGLHSPSLLAREVQLRGGRGGVYWLGSREIVTGLRWVTRGGEVLELPIDACQTC